MAVAVGEAPTLPRKKARNLAITGLWEMFCADLFSLRGTTAVTSATEEILD